MRFRWGILALSLAVLAACSTTDRSAAPPITSSGGSVASPTTGTSTTTTTPAPTTTSSSTPPEGVAGTLYAIERGGDLIEWDLATGRQQRWPLPDNVRLAAAREIAVLGEGLVIYELNGTAAAAVPYDDPSQARALDGERITGQALDVVVSEPAGAELSRLLDGRGGLFLEAPAELDWGISWNRVVMGDLVLDRSTSTLDLTWLLLTTGAEQPAGFDGLGPVNSSFFLAQRRLSERFGDCVLLRGSWERWAEPLEAVANLGFCSFDRKAVLSPDGRYVAETVGSVDDPNETRVYDLETGERRSVYRIDGSLQPTGFTADSGHLVMADGLERGTVSIVPIDAGGTAATVDFGAPLRAVALGPPTTAVN